MPPVTDGTSLRRPLLLGAGTLCVLFAAVGAVVAWVGTDRVAEQGHRDARELHEARESARAVHAAQDLAGGVRTRLEDARRAAEIVAAAASRVAAEVDPPIDTGAFESLPGSSLRWHTRPGSDVFALALPREDADTTVLAGWAARLGPVLRAAVDRDAGLGRVTLTLEGIGAVGSPLPDAAALLRIDAELRGGNAPDAAQWVEADRRRFVFAAPVTAAGRRIGTAWSEISPAAVAEWLAANAPHQGAGAVLSSAGAPLAHDGSFMGALGIPHLPEPGADPVAAALHPLTAGEGVFYPDAGGRHVVHAGRRFTAAGVPGTPFSVAVVGRVAPLPFALDDDTEDAARRLGVAVFALSLVFGAATLLWAWYMGRLHARRMVPLVGGVRALERGNYAQTLEAGADDELGAIARGLNAAAVRLRNATSRAEESDRRLAKLIETSGDGFVTTDADDRIVQVNARFAELVRRPPSSMVGHFVEELVLPESLERYRVQLKRQREGRPARLELVWNAARAPHPRTMAAGVPLFDDKGRYCGSYVIVTDLTDKVRAHDEMARAEKLRALAEMAGGVAHDFNNVLTVILGNTQFLLLDELTPDQQDTLKVIERTALEGTETVRRIREFTRSRSVPVNAHLVSMSDVVEEVMQHARKRFEDASRASGVEYRVVVERKSRRRVRGTSAELHEALANVVENALDAMPKGGTVTVEAFDRGEDSVAVRVEDTGVGITPEQLKKVFDPFFTTKQGGRCPGLGLSIAYGIVRAHRGRIDVRSEPGQGSTFTIVLPAAAAEQPAPQPVEGAAPKVEPRVLLVGAEPGMMTQLLDELRGLGVYAASVHPASAHALISDAGIFNTLVVEYEMGAGTGWELARQARAARKDLRILLLTTPSAPVSETQARNAGIDRVLVRPFDARDLHAEIFALLASPPERPEAPVPASVRNRNAPAPRPRDDELDSKTSEIWTDRAIVPLVLPDEDLGDADSTEAPSPAPADPTPCGAPRGATATGGAVLPPTGGQT